MKLGTWLQSLRHPEDSGILFNFVISVPPISKNKMTYDKKNHIKNLNQKKEHKSKETDVLKYL